MIFCVFTLAADSSHRPRGVRIDCRNILMKMFFEGLSKGGRKLLRPVARRSDFCRWNGIACDPSYEIQEISYRNFDNWGNFNIHAVPPTTLNLEISQCRQTFHMDMRMLPRNLQYVNLSNNQITGILDLIVLPEKIQQFIVENNLLTGYINLTNLPRTLQALNVGKNKIQQRTVYYDDLPDRLGHVTLVMDYGKEHIYQVRALDPARAEPNRLTFPHFPKDHVH
uniref:Leucine-rich repeat-containing N-terminal plant-type domain-containing protein n=1 Tax=Paramoeba aestuarina TaxID=180227 RepID=A0A7S4KHD4_9EUKA|mmetsp:Transcript_19282/g.30194  ORF Transcript_19282/g.30194 Transcript_19282/m.30194 type:complete len:224 (+) Transcript_19282:72-743(+)